MSLSDLYVLDFGKERIDYIKHPELLMTVLTQKPETLLRYIKVKHFDIHFPENHNVRYNEGTFLIRYNGTWNIIFQDDVVDKLYESAFADITKFLNSNQEFWFNNFPDEYENYKEFWSLENWSGHREKQAKKYIKQYLNTIKNKKHTVEFHKADYISLADMIKLGKMRKYSFEMVVADNIDKSNINDIYFIYINNTWKMIKK